MAYLAISFRLKFFWGEKGLSGRTIEPKDGSEHDLAMNPKRSNWADHVDVTNLKKIEMAPG